MMNQNWFDLFCIRFNENQFSLLFILFFLEKEVKIDFD